MRASSVEWVTAVIRGCSMVSSSPTTKVPGASSKLDRQWMRTPWLRAYSTERSCSTPAPEAAISSISSNETTGSLRASGTIRGSALKTPGDVGVDLAHVGADGGGERDRGRVRAAAAERRDVAARSRRPGSRRRARSCPRRARSRMRSARTSRMRALVCEVSVTIPACEPVSEIARWPRSLIAIAHSAQEMRSPVESSMSISRGSGAARPPRPSAISSSVVLPRAREHRDDAVALLALRRRSAARRA